MTMTDERPAVIPGYAQTPEAQHPPADAGGSIEQVDAVREHKDKSPCPECGKLIMTKNLPQHLRNIHKMYKGRGGKVKTIHSILAEREPKPVKIKKPTAEEIVLITVQMRWPNGVPVDKVPGLMAWAKQTERFFNE
jgi:predicted RNA-binding Zn-ribbon protein involved in translation (DUF1610 family)